MMGEVATAVAEMRARFPKPPETLMEIRVSWTVPSGGTVTLTVADNDWSGDQDDES